MIQKHEKARAVIYDQTRYPNPEELSQEIKDFENLETKLNGILSTMQTIGGKKQRAALMNEIKNKKQKINIEKSTATEEEKKRLATEKKEEAKKAADLKKKQIEETKKKIVEKISTQLKSLQLNLKEAGNLALVKKWTSLALKEVYYDDYKKTVKELGESIKNFKALNDLIPKKYALFKKIINIEKKLATAWRISLNNIIEISEDWYKLYTDPAIDFRNKITTKEKINYYGNEWYKDMKSKIQKDRDVPKKFATIQKIKEHSELLQAMYKDMLDERGTFEAEEGTLPNVYYGLGALAGGRYRLLGSKSLSDAIAFKIKKE